MRTMLRIAVAVAFVGVQFGCGKRSEPVEPEAKAESPAVATEAATPAAPKPEPAPPPKTAAVPARPAPPAPAPAKPADPVTISAPETTWIPVNWRSGSFGGGFSYETPRFFVKYVKNGGALGEVEIVSALTVTTGKGEMTFSAAWVADLPGDTGTIRCHWSDPMGTRDYEGKGTLKVFLRLKRNQKRVSNELRIPVAIDTEIKAELEKKYGPFKPGP